MTSTERPTRDHPFLTRLADHPAFGVSLASANVRLYRLHTDDAGSDFVATFTSLRYAIDYVTALERTEDSR